MRLLLITNPAAGKNGGRQIAEQALVFLSSQNHQAEIMLSVYAGHAVEIARETDASQYDGIIAVGGDGTLFEVLNGLLKSNPELKIPLGQIPLGTGNSFIKDLNVNNPQDALEKIIAGATCPVDVGYFSSAVGDYYFVNLLGFGFVSNVAHRAGKYKLFGDLSYILGVLEELVILSSTRLDITIDGKQYQRDNIFVEICNSTRTGGDMIMAPEAKIDDGFLDIVMLNKVSRRKLLNAFPKIFKGTHIEMDEVEVIPAKHIIAKTEKPQVLTPDGEVFGTTPIEVKILPQKIRMFG